MKLTIVVLLVILAAIVPAQTLNPQLSVPAVQPGGTTTLSVVFTDGPTPSNVAGIEWGLTIPSSIQAGPWTAISNKTLSCNGLLCLEYMTTAPITPFASGTIATIPLTVPLTVTPGLISITLSAALAPATNGGSPVNALDAVDLNVAGVTLTSTPVNLIVLSKYDLNADGKVDNADVQIALSQALKNLPCTNGDVNGDGKCNIKDVILVIYASLGKIPL